MEAGLPEELLLLALHDEKGSVIPGAAPVLNGALVGAALMELALRGLLHENADRTVTASPTPLVTRSSTGSRRRSPPPILPARRASGSSSSVDRCQT